VQSSRTSLVLWRDMFHFQNRKVLFYLEKRGKSFLRNVGKFIRCYVVSHYRGSIIYGFSVYLVTLLAVLVGKNVRVSEH
jgi:hypothetical protein